MRYSLKEFLRQQSWLIPLRLARLRRVTAAGLPDWVRILDGGERSEVANAHGQRRVLIGTSVGLHLAVNTLDSVLAAALSLRDAEVEVLLCDSALPACMACQANWFPRLDRFLSCGPKDFCDICHDHAARMYADLGIKVRRYSEFLTAEDREFAHRVACETADDAIPSLVIDGISIGEHALSGALRFLARGSLNGEPDGRSILRKYLEAAVLAARVGRRLFVECRFDVAVFHHGIYVPQGLLCDTARQAGVRVATWNPAYRQRCFIFSHDDTYHRTLMNEPVETWADLPWTAELDSAIMSYLASRWDGSKDWITFNANPRSDLAGIAREFDIDFSCPVVVLLTNVIWDAQLHYRANAFDTMMDWVLGTIAHFAQRSDLQLVIRTHPAEVTGSIVSRQRVADEIQKAFPELPSNIKVIPAEHSASTYVIATNSAAALIYGTKMGVELTSVGVPVIVAGEAWIRDKGITWDATSPEEYYALLDQLPFGTGLDPKIVERARKYAFHFFFRRMIPLEAIEPASGLPPYRVAQRSLSGLRPGASRGLDVICDGILNGTPFIYPAEDQIAG